MPAVERLSLRELGSFFDLLLVASTETTSNAIAHGLRLFTGFPAQRELLMSDFDARIGGAVEEIARYASPIIQFRRTLTCDYQMRGHAFAKGDKVVMFYLSANHDDTVFDRPAEFDITRYPNPHVGFGGGGPHHCIGVHLARREITAIFRELFTRFPGIRAVGEPEWLLSSFDNGITRLGFELGRARRRAATPGEAAPDTRLVRMTVVMPRADAWPFAASARQLLRDRHLPRNCVNSISWPAAAQLPVPPRKG